MRPIVDCDIPLKNSARFRENRQQLYLADGREQVKIETYMVGVAQLVRAPDCGSGCRGFESPHSPSGSLDLPICVHI